MPGTWRHIDNPEIGSLEIISRTIASAERGGRNPFPSLRESSAVAFFSDYGGEHKRAAWSTYSFLAVTMESAAQWARVTRKLRSQWLPDRRVFEYKGLGDRVRQRTLPLFLESAEKLPGILFCFAVPKRLRTIFRERSAEEVSELRKRLDETVRPHVQEKLLRVIHLLGLLFAGLTAEGQDVFWITDEDSLAVPTYPRLRLLTDVLATVSSKILQHSLRHLRVGTSKDSGDLGVSDLMSIPDLAAGMVENHLGNKVLLRRAPSADLTLPYLRLVPEAADLLSRWFAEESGVLRRVAVLIDDVEPAGLRATRLNFHASAFPPIPVLGFPF